LIHARSLEEVPTPALVIDLPRLTTNIRRMASLAADIGVELWPHTKTHKSREIARLQQENGAAGLTVATLREAEVLRKSGFDRLLIAYPPIGAWRLEILARLVRDSDVRVALDSIEAAEMLDATARGSGQPFRYLWEVDCGVGRCGTSAGADTATRVTDATRRFSHASFDGILTFGGHAYGAVDEASLVAAAQDEKDALEQTLAALNDSGLEARARSAGTTPTSHRLTRRGPITEIRPGNYVFYDATQVALGVVTEDRCALSVLATVVSRPSARRLILDCGSKALAAERLSVRTPNFGLVAGHPELTVERLYEEHAIVYAEEGSPIKLGSRLRVIPNHACATVNLHANMLIVTGTEVVDRWTVDARGWDGAA
jgi:D-serine deaminase-like pyridoxal phosphate-dependent protein